MKIFFHKEHKMRNYSHSSMININEYVKKEKTNDQLI